MTSREQRDDRTGYQDDVRDERRHEPDRGHDADGTAYRDDRPTHHDLETRRSAVTTGPADDLAAERERYGGVKVGSAFFGWLAAMGLAVLLTSLVAAGGTALGLADADTAENLDASEGSIALAGAAAVLVILFVAYLGGGYVAGRMARLDGARQGFAVWVWAVVVAAVLAVVAVVAGDEYDVQAQLNNFPRIPVGEGDLTTTGIVAAVAAAVVSLVGAVLGGVLGMRYHRRMDRARWAA
jgi:hypothetical protein